ncbi:G/T mismatches repair enzyme [Candidatus Anstonella stagnisolia]|nr:G/T mismatches repair enzyme [Candidatus Anstonella stagnisolia]
MEGFDARKKRFMRILSILKRTYPHAKCSLDFGNDVQLLVAVILSAQCTDARVNKETPALFAKCKSAKDFAAMPQAQMEKYVRSCGFFRTKAKNIRETCRILDEQHGGKIPRTMEEMLRLPGVARKTASIVLGNAHGILEGIPVDTHAIRLSQRMGLTREKEQNKIEKDLQKIVPHEDWLNISNLFVFHGRALCTARKPKCKECPILSYCPYGKKAAKS